MSGYLDEYGVTDAKRERKAKRLALIAVLVVVVGVAAFYGLRNFREKRLVSQFRSLIAEEKLEQAYRMWCNEGHPCPAYPYEKFLEDWGPESRYAKAGGEKVPVTRAEYCEEGTIITLTLAEDDTMALWVDHDLVKLSFSPWPVCNPVVRVPRPTY